MQWPAKGSTPLRHIIQPGLLAALIVTSPALFAEKMELPTLNCRIEPHVVIDVSSAVEGLIDDMLVDKNQRVTKGQKLALLESDVEKVTVNLRRIQAEMEGDFNAKQLAYEYSLRKQERMKGLYEKKAVPFQQMDEAKTETAVAAQQLQQAKDRKLQAKLEYQRARESLKRRTITSPINGLVVDRFKDPGEHVEDEPLLQLAQLDPLRVEVFAPITMFGLIEPGMKGEIIPDLPNQQGIYKGEVVMVDQVIDAPSNTFGIRLAFPNPDYKLPSGLKCKVRFPNVMVETAPLLGSDVPLADSPETFSIDLESQQSDSNWR